MGFKSTEGEISQKVRKTQKMNREAHEWTFTKAVAGGALQKPAWSDTDEMGQKYPTEPSTGHAKKAGFSLIKRNITGH